jgi:hypothetical protein
MLNEDQYIQALYDLKRAMDYLPIKACHMANKRKPMDTTFVYISQDRLAIMYSLLQGCPCLYTRQDKTGIIYNPSQGPQEGSGNIKEPNNSNSDKSSMIGTDPEQKSYFNTIPYKDVLHDNDDSMFQQFLRALNTVSGKKTIDFFWYIVFKTLFYFFMPM